MQVPTVFARKVVNFPTTVREISTKTYNSVENVNIKKKMCRKTEKSPNEYSSLCLASFFFNSYKYIFDSLILLCIYFGLFLYFVFL